jgi:hypothetical protein
MDPQRFSEYEEDYLKFRLGLNPLLSKYLENKALGSKYIEILDFKINELI